MYRFNSDYLEGAHPNILKRLTETNLIQTAGYGLDPICDSAKNKIRTACNAPDAKVYFMVGGPQTNYTVLDSILKGYEGVLSADTGHVAVHEAGAIEYSGHKVITIPALDGKIAYDRAKDYLIRRNTERCIPKQSLSHCAPFAMNTECGFFLTEQDLAMAWHPMEVI